MANLTQTLVANGKIMVTISDRQLDTYVGLHVDFTDDKGNLLLRISTVSDTQEVIMENDHVQDCE